MFRSVAVMGLVGALIGCSSHASNASDGDAGGASDGGMTTMDAGPAYPCNGHTELCSRRFDQVAYACAHNAHSTEEYGFKSGIANHVSGLAKQLDDGIRCFLIDIYDNAGEHDLCHVSCSFGKKPHAEALAIFKAFLDAHPYEVITLDYEDYIPANDIAADLAAAQLADTMFVYDATAGWPTLSQMIDSHKRLVVGIEGKTTTSGLPTAVHLFYDLAWDTPFTFTQPSDFTCTLNRGSRQNALFLLNHWLSSGGFPVKAQAPTANAYDLLYGRAKQCESEAMDFPNFIAVDFYETGDLMRVVNTLNGF